MSTSIGFQPVGHTVTSRRQLERLADVDPRLTRTHYFDNRLLTDRDLNRDQSYLDGRLREVGQALGQGVMRGLALSYDALTGDINVEPGIAISAAGRVLELTTPLTLDIGDRGKLVDLNNGKHRRLTRGLYAVVIQYTELPTDVAEVFPSDLSSERGFDYDVVTEGVRIVLVPLPLALPVQNPLSIRANLMASLSKDASVVGSIPEDGTALGVLAVSDDRPQWLDSELLRQPLRTTARAGDAQRDLLRQYKVLFDDLMAFRREGSLTGDFAAAEHFNLIPPTGPLPKESIDPVNGRQSFFPENYRVAVAPIRRAELELIMEESLVLPNLDLSLDEEQDIVVLAPLNSADFGQFAQQLEEPLNPERNVLPKLNLLRLRLYPRRPVHQVDTDAAAWQAIWDTVQEDELIYVRRPVRVAETKTSAIVLATGVDVPAPAPSPGPNPSPADDGPGNPTPPPSPSDGPILQDEATVFLNRINLGSLIRLREPAEDEGAQAARELESEFASDADITQQVSNALVLIEQQYDEVLWQTLHDLARSNTLRRFNQTLRESRNEDQTTAEIVLNLGAELNINPRILDGWRSIGGSEA